MLQDTIEETTIFFFFYSFSSDALIPSLQCEDLRMKYYFNESPLRDRPLTCETARLFFNLLQTSL